MNTKKKQTNKQTKNTTFVINEFNFHHTHTHTHTHRVAACAFQCLSHCDDQFQATERNNNDIINVVQFE